jgi:hypothetical protein
MRELSSRIKAVLRRTVAIRTEQPLKRQSASPTTKRIMENHGGDTAASNAPSGGLLIVTMRFPPYEITPGTDAGRRSEVIR